MGTISKHLLLASAIGLSLAGPVNATTWNYSGAISDCNMTLCELVPLFIGDTVSGEITIDVGANDAFTLPAGFVNFSFVVGGFSVDPTNIDFSGSMGTTDANGDFASGTLNGAIVGGQLAGLGGAFVIELVTGDINVTLGGGTIFVASVAGSFTQQAVPLPAAIWLMASAVLGLAGLIRRRR